MAKSAAAKKQITRQCKGIARSTGKRCKKHAMKGRDYCAKHGGKVPAGTAHPNYTHGGDSRFVPNTLRATYDSIQAQGIDAQLSVSHEITLLSARLDQVMAKVSTGEAGQTWVDLRARWREFAAAIRRQDTEAQQDLLPQLNQLISRGHSDSVLWTEAGALVMRIEKLKASERRRIVEAKRVVELEQVMGLLTANLDAFTKSVQRNVEGEAAQRILDDAQRIYDKLVGPSARSLANG